MRGDKAMRILILGGNGMLGHQLFRFLLKHHEVRSTIRQDLSLFEKFKFIKPSNTYPNIDVRNLEQLNAILEDFRPHAVVNAVGIVKQLKEANQHIPCIEINSLFPHRLANMCKNIGARLLHLSTDCVFSGNKGNYVESDVSDAEDLYGRTKFLGEVAESHCLTLRTSIIGRELTRKKNLLEWFLAQQESVKGYKRVIFNGFTTLELSCIIENILTYYPDKNGIYHVSSAPISKFNLLNIIKDKLDLSIKVIPDEEILCDRSLDSTKYRKEFEYTPPEWERMIEELHQDLKQSNLYG